MANLTTAATGFPASLDTYSTQAANNRILSSHYNGALGAIVALETTIGTTKTLGSVLFAGASGNYAEDNTNLFWDDTNNQLQLAATGSGAGILIGGDVQWYRSAANVMRTPDSLTVDSNLVISGAGAHTMVGQLQLSTTGSGAGVLIGGDTQLYRSAANVLYTPDSLTVAGGSVRINEGRLELDIATDVFTIRSLGANVLVFENQLAAEVARLHGGQLLVGTTALTAQAVVDQASTTAAIEVLALEQRDLDQAFLHFATTIGTGNAIEAVAAKTLTTTHFLMVDIDGVGTRYIPMGTIA